MDPEDAWGCELKRSVDIYTRSSRQPGPKPDSNLNTSLTKTFLRLQIVDMEKRFWNDTYIPADDSMQFRSEHSRMKKKLYVTSF